LFLVLTMLSCNNRLLKTLGFLVDRHRTDAVAQSIRRLTIIVPVQLLYVLRIKEIILRSAELAALTVSRAGLLFLF